MEKEFNRCAMRDWCETQLLEGAQAFRDMKGVMEELCLIDAKHYDEACWYSLGFVAAFGFAMAMFEDGVERDSFDIAAQLSTTFAYCYTERGKEGSDEE